VAGWSVRDERDKAAPAILDEDFGSDVLLEETLELLSEGCGDLWR
jgi:hypothetical protein